MKSPGFHLCSWRKPGCLCPCPGPGRALGGRKDRQSRTFTPSRRKSIKTCCITAPLTFTRVTSAKSWQQISLPAGKQHVSPRLGILPPHSLGTRVPQSPSQPPGTQQTPRLTARPGGGIHSLPEQGQLIRCIIRENTVLSVLILHHSSGRGIRDKLNLQHDIRASAGAQTRIKASFAAQSNRL